MRKKDFLNYRLNMSFLFSFIPEMVSSQMPPLKGSSGVLRKFPGVGPEMIFSIIGDSVLVSAII